MAPIVNIRRSLDSLLFIGQETTAAKAFEDQQNANDNKIHHNKRVQGKVKRRGQAAAYRHEIDQLQQNAALSGIQSGRSTIIGGMNDNAEWSCPPNRASSHVELRSSGGTNNRDSYDRPSYQKKGQSRRVSTSNPNLAGRESHNSTLEYRIPESSEGEEEPDKFLRPMIPNALNEGSASTKSHRRSFKPISPKKTNEGSDDSRTSLHSVI